MISNLPGFGTVWYYAKGIANILSLSKVTKLFKVTFDSTTGKGFVVHKADGTSRRFQKSEKGLFYSVMNRQETVEKLKLA
eukprot:12816621-Ditylum_brightwellii.AAC.1